MTGSEWAPGANGIGGGLAQGGVLKTIRLVVNGRRHRLDADPETPLLWVLREHLGLTGTKYGCGIGVCGSCTVLLDGRALRACSTSARSAEGHRITTIEGLDPRGQHPLVRAWIAEEVSQCGYCQPGQLLTAAALLVRNAHPSDADIAAAMDGVLCRCGTYQRIRRAVHRAAQEG